MQHGNSLFCYFPTYVRNSELLSHQSCLAIFEWCVCGGRDANRCQSLVYSEIRVSVAETDSKGVRKILGEKMTRILVSKESLGDTPILGRKVQRW